MIGFRPGAGGTAPTVRGIWARVVCPVCEAAVGRRCMTLQPHDRRYLNNPHPARRNAAREAGHGS